MGALSAHEVVKKILKNGKNDLFYIRPGHMSETHNKKLFQ